MHPETPNGTIQARGFNWPEVRFSPRRIGEVVELRYGKALVKRNRSPGAVPMFGTNGQCGWHDTALSSGPGVILGRKGQGHLGVKWCPQDFWVIDTAYFADVDQSEVDLRWFYYITQYVGLDHLKTGEKPGLSRDIFSRQLFPFPAIDEQRAIAAVLGALDAKIEANRALYENLETMCRALFRSWFVDFDPVVAKSEGRKPPHLADDVATLFPDRFENSPIGPAPAGWRSSTIGKEVRVVGGSTPSTSVPEYWDGGTHHWITPKDLSLRPLPIVLETTRKITDQGLSKISSGLLPHGAVLLSSRAPIGYLAIAEVPLAVNQGFIAMVCEDSLPAHFVVQWCAANMDEITARAGGTTFAEISKANFRPIPLTVPSHPVLVAYQAIAEPSYTTIRALLEETATLAALRGALIPRLLSGELTVQQSEKLVEEAI